ncbi:MAG: hypothetical protein HKO91_03935 [Desulfobacterales bacterium]|nr:hypothetical protein [Desulfobacterales bacterium]
MKIKKILKWFLIVILSILIVLSVGLNILIVKKAFSSIKMFVGPRPAGNVTRINTMNGVKDSLRLLQP